MSSSRLLSWITRAGNYMEGYRYLSGEGRNCDQQFTVPADYLPRDNDLFEDTNSNIVVQQTQEQDIPEQDFSFYYPVSVEIDRVKKEKQKGKTLDETRELIKNNCIKALEEFAGKVSLTKLPPFIIQDGKMVAPGMSTPMSEMMKEWAENQNEQRLWSDYEGFLDIENGFQQGANVAILVSPPSFGQEGFGTYGFCNIFVRSGNQVIEYIFRYEGESSELPLSNALQANIQERLQYYNELQLLPAQTHTATHNENMFLETPLVVTMDNPYEQLSQILTDVGFAEARTMEMDNIFLKAIKSDESITDWRHKYTDLILKIESMKPSFERSLLEKEAEQLRDKCYNKSCDIKKAIDAQIKLEKAFKDEEEILESVRESSRHFDTREREDRYYGALRAVVIGGGSCPGAQSMSEGFTGYEVLSFSQSRYGWADLLKGTPTKKERILTCKKCPFCKKENVKAVIAKGKITCPSCKASAPYKC